MGSVHTLFSPTDCDFYSISIQLKSEMLCSVLTKYEDDLMANLAITINEDSFTFKDDQYQTYIPHFPEQIVLGLIDLLGSWSDCDYISYEIADQIIAELSENALILSNSVTEMEWISTFHGWDGNDMEEITSKTISTLKDGCFKYESSDDHITNRFDSKNLTGDRKLVYELIAKNHYLMPQLGTVLYKKYATTDSYNSLYHGQQFKNAVLKLSEQEFMAILDSLVNDSYLAIDKEDSLRISYSPVV